MPIIREYVSRAEVPGPVGARRASAEDFDIGRGLAAFGNGVSSVSEALYKRAEQNEISDLSAKVADANARLTNDWRERLKNADPNDTELANKFMEDYDSQMQKLGENVQTRGGQLFLNRSTSELRGHFSTTVVAGQAELAAVRATQNYEKSVDGLSSGLLVDPSGFKTAIDLHDAGIDEQVKAGALPVEAALKLKPRGAERLATSAIRGWIDLDPEDAKAQLKSGKWDSFIGGEVKHQLFAEAERSKTAKLIEQDRIRQQAERAKQEKQQVTQNEFLSLLSEGKLSANDILKSNLDPFGSGSKEQFLNLLKEHVSGNGMPKPDPATVQDVWERIHLPDGDPRKLNDENELNGMFGRLGIEWIKTFRAEIQGRRTGDGEIESQLKNGVIDIAKGQLTKSNPLTGIRDPIGDEQYQKFMSVFLKEYQAQRLQGKSPMDLLDPEKPDYLGKHILRFKRSEKQIMQDMVRGMNAQPGLVDAATAPLPTSGSPTPTPAPTGTPPPRGTPAPEEGGRKPGESAAAYLKRMKERKG